MRVLHFVSVPSRGSGVMSVIMNYYRHIDRDKIQFDFLCFIQCENSYEEEIGNLGGTITYISRPGFSRKAVWELKQFMKEHGRKYAWIHNHEVYLSFLLEPLAKEYGIPGFIIHSHTTKYSDRPLGAVRNRLLCWPIRYMKSSTDFCVQRFACSKAAGKFLYGDRQMREGGVFVLHNAIDCEKFRFDPEKRKRIRRDLGLENQFVIGHVGRFEKQKNHEFLIKVFAMCKKKETNCTLLLVGDGSLRPKIEDQVRELGLTASVIFLGQRNDVSDLYHGMDIFVLPSYYEGFPVSCLEAQVSGLPCIISQTITREVCISSTVAVMDIRENPEHWSRHICSYFEVNEEKRSEIATSTYKMAEDANYMLKKEVINLSQYYLGSNL